MSEKNIGEDKICLVVWYVVKDLVVVQTQVRPIIVWWTLKWKIVCYSVAKYAEVDNVVVWSCT